MKFASDAVSLVGSLSSEKKSSPDDPVAVDSVENSLKAMMVDIAEDLEYYCSDSQRCVVVETTSAATNVAIEDTTAKQARAVLLQDTHTAYINKHQLQVLRTEYSELLSTHTEAKMLMGTLLSELVELENAYAAEVKDSRQKDGARGASVIPDYQKVNQAADDIGSDAVVRAALKRAHDILILVQGIRVKFDL